MEKFWYSSIVQTHSLHFFSMSFRAERWNPFGIGFEIAISL